MLVVREHSDTGVIRYDTIRYTYVSSQADEMASLV